MDGNSITGNSLIILLWNANGLYLHRTELQILLQQKRIDIALITETHFTSQSRLFFPNYSIYTANHPDGTAHGGTAVIIRSSLRHFFHSSTSFDFLQAAAVTVYSLNFQLTVASIYCPPRFRIDSHSFTNFFNGLGTHFLAGGDFNSKHPLWGSRLTTPRGRNLHESILNNRLITISPPTPTHWPSNPNHLPDLLDFFVSRGLNRVNKTVDSLLDLSSDHSPVLLSLDLSLNSAPKKPTLTPGLMNWPLFQETVSNDLNLNVPLKTQQDIESAVDLFTTIVQQAAWSSSFPSSKNNFELHCPLHIRRLIHEKRRWRGIFQRSRLPSAKRRYNELNNELKRTIAEFNKDRYFSYTNNLRESDGSLWRATRRLLNHHKVRAPLRTDNHEWARSDSEKAELFAKHFYSVFNPHTDLTDDAHDQIVSDFLSAPLQLSPFPKTFSPSEVLSTITKLPNKKAPGLDLITGEILKHLPRKAIVFLTSIYNSILRTTFYPIQWKFSVLVVFPKPNKPEYRVDSYRPISLLSVCSKLFERLLLQRIVPIFESNGVIPLHQFGFQHGHSTTQQLHRVVDYIASGLEHKHYISGVFLDVSQAFDRVWHQGLLVKLKKILPDTYYRIIQSFLSHRFFAVRENNTLSSVYPIRAGVPQGSILSPVLYNIYTSDMPCTPDTLTATFADDTALLSRSPLSHHASANLQFHLTELSSWLNKWKIKVNPEKSAHITFSLRPGVCPPVYINNRAIPTQNTVKYLGITLDRRLTWAPHIKAKRDLLSNRTKSMYSLLGRRSSLPLSNKLLLYKLYLKPIWTYGCQIYGSAKRSNLSRLQVAQSKVLRIITKSPWYVRNDTIHNDLKIPYIHDELRRFYKRFHRKLGRHKNTLISHMFTHQLPDNPPRRLKRAWNRDLLQ